VARHFDGWFPISPDPESWGTQWQEIQAMARDAGRAPDAITGAFYLTLAVDDDARRAEKSLDQYLEAYYGQSAEVLKSFMTCYAGSSEGAAQLLDAYASAGVSHMVLRFAGDHDRLLETMIGIRESLGWASAS
jgi:alkanesulfonate monooxygenase SsuD/methylene tetrahydromethanopterin reductase-like flavin-dependent oxidoreductase (luciferase family)